MIAIPTLIIHDVVLAVTTLPSSTRARGHGPAAPCKGPGAVQQAKRVRQHTNAPRAGRGKPSIGEEEGWWWETKRDHTQPQRLRSHASEAHTPTFTQTCAFHPLAHRLEKLLRVFHKLDAKQDGKVCACMCHRGACAMMRMLSRRQNTTGDRL